MVGLCVNTYYVLGESWCQTVAITATPYHASTLTTTTTTITAFIAVFTTITLT